ncbi:hypothetical protein PCANC_01323 [Puccinia coronata f. sp. avenae]|uniref:DUF6589 domain-containing protein n=1 Tax=Puccinia coronata f. sp. avenae TaxID=200324 RepID=A0A2N5W6A1_9BASI|nr:hypothetical protein PCANC_01323 [Puccinia coronata f. sp. avenae]
MHFGDPSNREDLGAWSTLEALGLPSDQPLAKKDFTLMLNNIQKVHEVTLIHCLMFVMGASQKHLSNKKMKLSPERVKVVVDSCYDCFFSKKALTNALKLTSPKLKNLLLRLRDFGTIIEADRAMKAGDVGRLLNIWRRWSVMAQGIKGLSHYSISLPRMIMLITRVLSPGMRHVLQHSLLMSPSGRAKHFVAKDFFLKVQNYWLKYFYNHNGVGSDSKRLRDVFSLNVPLLQTLVQSIKEDSGVAVSHQSHKHIISLQAINAFLRMAVSKSIHNGSSVELVKTHKPVNDIMHLGILAMQADPLTGGAMLSRLNPSTNLLEQTFHSTNENPDENSLFDNPDHEMGCFFSSITH